MEAWAIQCQVSDYPAGTAEFAVEAVLSDGTPENYIDHGLNFGEFVVGINGDGADSVWITVAAKDGSGLGSEILSKKTLGPYTLSDVGVLEQ